MKPVGEKATVYSIQRWSGLWQDEGLEYEDYQEAKEELDFHRQLYPQERWRLVEKQTRIIWRR